LNDDDDDDDDNNNNNDHDDNYAKYENIALMNNIDSMMWGL